MIRAAVFIAVVAAKKTRLTPVLLFLFMGFALVNVGVVPVESDLDVRTGYDGDRGVVDYCLRHCA